MAMEKKLADISESSRLRLAGMFPTFAGNGRDAENSESSLSSNGGPSSLRSDGGASKIYRLKSDAVLDMAFVCHYSVS